MINGRIGQININYCVIDIYGNKNWYLDGIRHRIGGPAVIHTSGFKMWYQNGLCRRTDGPAIIYHDGGEEYWDNGNYIRWRDSDP